jgi:phosphoribosylcarboxyaminoimidazole (NCAIR) mutase
MNKDVAADTMVILGSPSDWKHGNVILEMFRDLAVTYVVSYASCHRNIGKEFETFITGIQEKIILCVGGMEFALPGILESIDRNAKMFNQIVLAVPTDKAARSAIENLPVGTAIITCGLNEICLNHGLQNSALMAGKLAGMLGNDNAFKCLALWYEKAAKKKPLVPKVELDHKGLIPDPNLQNIQIQCE